MLMLTSLILFYFIIIVSIYYVGTLRFFWMKSALQIKIIIIIIIYSAVFTTHWSALQSEAELLPYNTRDTVGEYAHDFMAVKVC